ncbi:Guanidinobutyrase [Lasiodiplodia theobromae]|uniref:Guanidinobutyrase n=1 Tax=Lasiodiplodia theobromae TaxID=45133 RepID=A0A5N5CW63_9PEZI|nr:Guanidinobutyrase [Lasiodiplodia theobromae]
MRTNVLFALLSPASAFLSTQQRPLHEDPEHLAELERKWGDNWAFSGISTFGHVPHVKCLTHPEESFDIGIIGVPFDTAVSYRPGARMGPRAIRAASGRHIISRGFHAQASVNPYTSWAKIIDCGDVPVTPFDNAVAMEQMTQALTELGTRRAAYPGDPVSGAPPMMKPKLLVLGGDHLVALPALRALKAVYNEPMVLLHFDSHLDTLHPNSYPSAWPSEQATFNHGSVFWQASNEGLLHNSSCVHAGINTRLTGGSDIDYESDDAMGFLRIPADAVDDVGVAGIVDAITSKIPKNAKVYLSIDIDVLDPAFAPGTGAPEPGGWSTREMIRILRGLRDLDIVGADIVEVAPAYDTPGADTAFVAAALGYEIITHMVKQGLNSVPANKDPLTKTEL